LPGSLVAQTTLADASPTGGVAFVPVHAGAVPTLTAARVGVDRVAPAHADAAVAERARLGRALSKRDSRLWMIVGGAAFVAGLLIGDDVGTVLAVGGAGFGLVGLYNYLK
nr:hypothetical protein [Gemmatimonadaceae bacterium]